MLLAAPTQREAQAGFQVFHVAADGAGADVQLQLGGRHAAAFRHAFEHLQQTQIHVTELPQHRTVPGVGVWRAGRADFADRDFDGREGSWGWCVFFHLHIVSSKH